MKKLLQVNNGMYIVSRWAIKDGKLDEFKKVIEAMLVVIDKLDPGAAFIDYYLSDDEKTSYGVEYYRTPAAYALAAELVKPMVPALMATSEDTLVWVLGEITPVVEKVLEGWSYEHGNFMTGFWDKGGKEIERMMAQAMARAGLPEEGEPPGSSE